MIITVFCSSNENEAYYPCARDLGHIIAENGGCLVYGGNDAGLMGEVVKSMHALYGLVVDVTTSEILYDDPEKYCSIIHKSLIEFADTIVILPGGIGTMAEFFDVYDFITIHESKKRIIIFNYLGYYDCLKEFITTMMNEKMLSEENANLLVFCNSKADIEAELKNTK